MSLTLPLLIKILLGFLIGLVIGYVVRVMSRPRLGPPLSLAKVHTVEIENTKVNYVREGTGPDLLLIHGMGASMFCWRLVFRPLTRFFRVTAVDLPGFGSSQKNIHLDYGLDGQTRRLKTFLDALDIDTVYIVGSSMGGTLALWLARLYPERVRGLVAISPAAHRKIIVFDLIRFEPLARVLGKAFLTPYMVERMARRAVSRADLVDRSAIEQYYRPYHKDEHAITTLWKAQATIRDSRLPEGLAELQTPTLILHGQKDKVIRERFIKEIAAIIPDSVLKLHSMGGHHLMEDEPDFVLSNIFSFFGVDPDGDKKIALIKS